MDLSNWEADHPETLTTEQALQIRDFKRRSTWRALCQAFLGHECQMTGRDLARDAARRLLGLSLEELWELEWGEDPSFDLDNAHGLGGAFWWE